MIIFQNFSKLLLLLHFLFTIFLIGGISHIYSYLIKIIKNNLSSEDWEKLKKIYNKTFIAYWGTFITGLMIYPTFKYYVSFMNMDNQFPKGNYFTFLFEVKEHWAALGLIIISVSYFIIIIDEQLQHNLFKKLFLFLNIILIVLIIYALITGFYLNTIKSI